ncbi:serine/threonine-protein kinase, partial [Singulisphaera rosea]
MSTRLDQHPRDGQFPDEGVIDLEPTVTLEAADPSLGPPVALAQGTMASLGGELDALRRSRLTSVAIFLSIVSLVIFVFNRIAGVPTQWLIPVLMGFRVVLTGAVAGFLVSKVSLTRSQLRTVEFVLFGGLTLVMCVGQYFVTHGFIEAQNVAGLIAYEKNTVLQLFALMVLYGMVIPNDAKNTARVVLTMALLPGLALALSLEHQDAEPMIEKLKTIEPLGAGLISVLIGASLAIYGAHVLNGLRVQLHEAKKFGQYKLVHKLGSGGMGDVYLAEHELLKRPCALKLIRSEVGAEPLAMARFEREVRSAARLSHPNTIEIFDYGHTDDGTFYYVMEYLQGLSLNELVSMAGPLPPGRVIYLFRQICAGLAEAHNLGLVHRDLKPANIYVAIRGGESDVAKVLDFG